jgi:hypothetical protein
MYNMTLEPLTKTRIYSYTHFRRFLTVLEYFLRSA